MTAYFFIETEGEWFDVLYTFSGDISGFYNWFAQQQPGTYRVIDKLAGLDFIATK